MTRISRLSSIALLAMVPMLIYYPYEAMSWNLELSFLDPGKWTRNAAWVDWDAEIAVTTRIVFFSVWFVPAALGWVAYLLAARILWQVRSGQIFDLMLAKRLRLMGLYGFTSASSALVAGAMSPMIRSWHNADGPLPLRFWYDSGSIGLAFSGLAFFFIGQILDEAVRMARENEEFI